MPRKKNDLLEVLEPIPQEQMEDQADMASAAGASGQEDISEILASMDGRPQMKHLKTPLPLPIPPMPLKIQSRIRPSPSVPLERKRPRPLYLWKHLRLPLPLRKFWSRNQLPDHRPAVFRWMTQSSLWMSGVRQRLMRASRIPSGMRYTMPTAPI